MDNGVSGTVAFSERPGFAQLMEAVRRGRVRCIVVKDLSRFGRDYLEAATYIEHVFPLLGVRLIAITDNFDSIRPEDVNGLALPVKNLINTMYAKDIGKKIKSSYDVREKEERWFGISAPYGYFKEGESGNWSLVPDPETAGHVRAIFHWYISGVGVTDIARRLNFTGVMNPGRRKSQYEDPKRRGHRAPDGWGDTGVQQILQNQSYVGDTVNRKCMEGRSKLKDREEWQIIPDTHEGLVPREDFEKAWAIMDRACKHAQKRYETTLENRAESPPLFSGKIFCGVCGNSFHVVYQDCGDGFKEKFYRCSSRNCINSRHSTHEEVFKILIMDQIRLLVKAACDYRKLAKDLISEDPTKGKAGSIKVKLTNGRVELKRIEERALKAYEEYAEGAMKRDDYIRLKEKLAAEKRDAEIYIGTLEAEELELKEKAGEFIKITRDFEGYLDMEGYLQEAVDRLVEKIEYSRDGSLKLILKCADVYEDIFQFLDMEKLDAETVNMEAPAPLQAHDTSAG